MKSLFAALAMLFSSAILFAQDDLVPKDAKAKEILDAVSAKTKTYSAIVAKFSYRMLDEGAGIDEVQSGTISIKDGKYKLELAGQQVICDGTNLWTVISDGDECEVQIDVAPDPEEEEEGAINPAKIFSIYESGFKYKYEGTSTIDGAAHHSVKLFPIQAGEKSYHQVKLLINDATKQIKEIVIYQKEGGTLTYTLSDFNGKATLSDASFSYDKSLGCDIVDLR